MSHQLNLPFDTEIIETPLDEEDVELLELLSEYEETDGSTEEEREAKRIRAELEAEKLNPLHPPTITRYREQLVFPAVHNDIDSDEE